MPHLRTKVESWGLVEGIDVQTDEVLEACDLALEVLVASWSRGTKSALQVPLRKPGTLHKQTDMPTCLQHSNHLLITFNRNSRTAVDISVAEAVQVVFICLFKLS